MDDVDETHELRLAFKDLSNLNLTLIEQLSSVRAELERARFQLKIYEQALESSARMEDFFREKLGSESK